MLFTISANLRGTDGATIGIEMTAHAPLAASDTAKVADLKKEFLAQCGVGFGGTPITDDTLVANGSTLMLLDLTSSNQGQDFVSPVDLYLGSRYFAQAASGSGILPPDKSLGCYGTHSWSKSGTAHGIADFQSGNASPDLAQWRYGLYGFAVRYGSGATIEACRIVLAPLAQSAGLDSITGWNPNDTSGTSCAVGYTGE
ncbi:MAG: hypothetical protein ACYCZY_01750 [Lacisediminihabitans sp.]